MAQGYLNADDNNVRRELKGKEYFEYLTTRSFFQDFQKDAHGNIISCKMHDLVHEYVQFLTEDRFVTEELVGNLTLDLSSRKVRHLRLVIRNCKSSPLCIYGIEKLRSLVVASDDKTSGDAFHDLISRSKLLRLLEFDSFHLRPEEIVLGMDNLIHLRYLSLISCSGLENLPEAVCELISLLSLNLRDCLNLHKLAVGIGKLINLRCLSIKDCPRLTYYPKGISNLASLESLSGIKVRIDQSDGDQLSIGDLENLDLLGGNLSVELIGDSIDWNEAKRAKLHMKIHLKRMDIWICSGDLKEDEVLQALNLPSNFPVVLFDYRRWFNSNDACIKRLTIKEKIRVSLYVQKAALQFIDAAVGKPGRSTSAESSEDPTD
ncbi:Cc-nbs-lrr resistance protein, putative isoform 2 [Hibiscus syriacus]|uniref:Cc-nbs-lrr resistance protein, putative isoform 2 n=2 Tax=Hibiscus syriacus TaxID=106335 RepID=A0A6A2YXU1_HIBSY|nr:Cc-nbs-lrr resistance protein, putative isoform 2 [Hibiscus syriacus]